MNNWFVPQIGNKSNARTILDAIRSARNMGFLSEEDYTLALMYFKEEKYKDIRDLMIAADCEEFADCLKHCI